MVVSQRITCTTRYTIGKPVEYCGGFKGTTQSYVTLKQCNSFPACCYREISNGKGECWTRDADMPVSTIFAWFAKQITRLNIDKFSDKESSPIEIEDQGVQDGTQTFVVSGGNLKPQTSQQTWFQQNFGSMSRNFQVGPAVQNQVKNLPKSPVDVPLCQRVKCLKDDNDRLENDAWACHLESGCYFDLTLHLYKKMFGAFPNVPTCHRSITSPLFINLTQTVKIRGSGNWKPEKAPIIISELQKLENNDPSMWSRLNNCPHMHPVDTFKKIANRYAKSINLIKAGSNSPEFKFIKNIQSTSQLILISKSVVDVLSPTCDAVNKFQCQMKNCCWIDDSSTSGFGKNGRCVKNFNIKTYSSDLDFAKAVTLALRFVMKRDEVLDISEARVCRTYKQTPQTDKCGEFSDNSRLDEITCLARGCCFDQEIWDLNKKRLAGVRIKQSLLVDNNCEWNNLYNGLYGLPSIDGDSSSCCERKACYSVGSVLESQWTSWTEWLPCSKSCDGGTRERFRQCRNTKDLSEMSDDQCIGLSVDQEDCNTQFCGALDPNLDELLFQPTLRPQKTPEQVKKQQVFEYWSEWSECSQTCGQTAERIREQGY